MENQLTYRPEIDGLRALAVLGVLAFHFDISMFSGGFVGVDVFFVISGYLICGLLLRSAEFLGPKVPAAVAYRCSRYFMCLADVGLLAVDK